MISLPAELYDAITILVEAPPHFDSRYQMRRDETYDHRSREARKHLSTLRLANKQFRQSASIRLFRCIRATINGAVRETNWPLARLLELCNSPYASLVRRLQIGYDYFDHPAATDWEPGSKYNVYAEDAAHLLPMCLSKLPRLETLDVRGPSFPSLKAPVEHQMRLFTNSIVSALRYVKLPDLAELNLRLAVTREYGEFFYQHPTASRIPVSDVMHQLRHLEVATSDFTGRDSRRNGNITLSALSETYPNADFLSSPLNLIELATGLESLSVSGSDVFNLDSLQLDSGVCLKYIKLSRVAISAGTMMRVLEQSRYSLRGIHFVWVELDSGTWAEILDKLCTFPQLSYVHLHTCGYSPAASTEPLKLAQPSFRGISDDIKTAEPMDHDSLGNLQRHVIDVREKAGMLPYGKEDPHIRRAVSRPQEPEASTVSSVGENNVP